MTFQAENIVLQRDGVRVLNAASIRFSAGITVLIGPNGAGKSLLLRVLHGLIVPDAGTFGDVPERQAMVFQKPVMLRRSVLRNVEFARALGQGGPTAHAWLDQAGLGDKAQMPARQLSGGEAQLLAVIRALATGPQLLFLDEPTSHLDPAATARIEALITQAAASGVQVVLVSHDLGQVRRLAQDVAFMHKGKVLEQGLAEDVLSAPTSREAAQFIKGELVL